MRKGLFALWILFWSATSAVAQVSVGIGFPGVSIGINLPVFPELVQVPGYPVYYAPRLDTNFFFYDGLYWVYDGDNWYASSWYNGPWGLVAPVVVPLFVLRIPVRYYRNPPAYFRVWRSDAPPRWGERWGARWEQRRSGWDRWNRSSVPALAPLPVYQRQYSADRYPRVDQQPAIHSQNYRYQPRNAVVRQHYQQQSVPRAREQQAAPQERGPRQQDIQRSSPPPPLPQGGPAVQSPQLPRRGGEEIQRSAPSQAPPLQRGPAARDQRQGPGATREDVPRGKGAAHAPGWKQGQEKHGEKNEERDRERNK